MSSRTGRLPAAAPRRSRRLATQVSKPEANNEETQQPAAAGASKQPRGRPRKSGIPDNNGNSDEDNREPLDPPSGPSGSTKQHNQRVRCKFCIENLEIDAVQPCDFERGFVMAKMIRECSNCADYRSKNPGVEYRCIIKTGPKTVRRYGCADPYEFPPDSICDGCKTKQKERGCDVDPFLRYSCSLCPDKSPCKLNGKEMDRRPKLRQGFQKWMRRTCDSCNSLATTRKGQGVPECDWTQDRRLWGRPCGRCRRMKMLCRDGALAQEPGPPQDLFPPNSWKTYDWITEGYLDLRPNTPWRKICIHCKRDGNHCRAASNRPYSACNRCTQFGIDCVDAAGTLYPLFDLSQVGFGQMTPFPKCLRCDNENRNCDRQRPCDSCHKHGEGHLCDQRGPKGNGSGSLIWTRLNPAPGPMYYLALGYSGEGVETLKSNSELEHWVGPIFAIYGYGRDKKGEKALVNKGMASRDMMLPPEVPPHAVPGSVLATTPPSSITVQMIRDMLFAQWNGVFTPHRHPGYVFALRRVAAGRSRKPKQQQQPADPNQQKQPADPSQQQPADRGPDQGDTDDSGPDDEDGGETSSGNDDDDDDAPGEEIQPQYQVAYPQAVISNIQTQLPVGPPRPGAAAVPAIRVTALPEPMRLQDVAPQNTYPGLFQAPQNVLPEVSQDNISNQPVQGSSSQQAAPTDPLPTTQDAQNAPTPTPLLPLTYSSPRQAAYADLLQRAQEAHDPFTVIPPLQFADSSSQQAGFTTPFQPTQDAQNAFTTSPPLPFPAGGLLENPAWSLLPPQPADTQEDVVMGGTDEASEAVNFDEYVLCSDTQSPPNPPTTPTRQSQEDHEMSNSPLTAMCNQANSATQNPASELNAPGSYGVPYNEYSQPSQQGEDIPPALVVPSGSHAQMASYYSQTAVAGQAAPMAVMSGAMPPAPPTPFASTFPGQSSNQGYLVISTDGTPQPQHQYGQQPGYYPSHGQAQTGSFVSNTGANPQSRQQYAPQPSQTNTPGVPVDPQLQAVIDQAQPPFNQDDSTTSFQVLLSKTKMDPALFPEAQQNLGYERLGSLQALGLMNNFHIFKDSPLANPNGFNALQTFDTSFAKALPPVSAVERSPSEKPDDPTYVEPRWRRLNPYHRADGSLVLKDMKQKREVMEVLEWKVFGRVLHETNPNDPSQLMSVNLRDENPLRNVLGTVPEVDHNGQRLAKKRQSSSPGAVGGASSSSSDTATDIANMSLRQCMEHQPGKQFEVCGTAVTRDDQCISREHIGKGARPHVCHPCAKESSAMLFDQRFKAITSDEIRRMRAYLCDGCTERYGRKPGSMAKLREVGFNAVWGRFANHIFNNQNEQTMDEYGVMHFYPRALPMTGCSCAVKMARARVCKFHRYENAERALHSANRAREWRMQTFGRPVCPACLLSTSWQKANEATDEMILANQSFLTAQDIRQIEDMHDNRVRSWVCFSCSGWVINQRNKPRLVPGWQDWFDPRPRAVSEAEDISMSPSHVFPRSSPES